MYFAVVFITAYSVLIFFLIYNNNNPFILRWRRKKEKEKRCCTIFNINHFACWIVISLWSCLCAYVFPRWFVSILKSYEGTALKAPMPFLTTVLTAFSHVPLRRTVKYDYYTVLCSTAFFPSHPERPGKKHEAKHCVVV